MQRYHPARQVRDAQRLTITVMIGTSKPKVDVSESASQRTLALLDRRSNQKEETGDLNSSNSNRREAIGVLSSHNNQRVASGDLSNLVVVQTWDRSRLQEVHGSQQAPEDTSLKDVPKMLGDDAPGTQFVWPIPDSPILFPVQMRTAHIRRKLAIVASSAFPRDRSGELPPREFQAMNSDD
jgi:hypothetical protein